MKPFGFTVGSLLHTALSEYPGGGGGGELSRDLAVVRPLGSGDRYLSITDTGSSLPPLKSGTGGGRGRLVRGAYNFGWNPVLILGIQVYISPEVLSSGEGWYCRTSFCIWLSMCSIVSKWLEMCSSTKSNQQVTVTSELAE